MAATALTSGVPALVSVRARDFAARRRTALLIAALCLVVGLSTVLLYFEGSRANMLYVILG